MIRHFDGSNAEQITMQAKRGVIWAVEWTWRKHRICMTLAQAERARDAWKRWYERRGWKVIGHRAYHPRDKVEHMRSPAVCNIVKYDSRTREVLNVR